MARALEMDESTETVAGSVLGLRLTLIFLPLVLRRAIDWLRAQGNNKSMDAYMAGESGVSLHLVILSAAEFALLVHFMRGNDCVTELCLSERGSDIEGHDIAALCGALASNTTLKQLELEGVYVGLKGARALGRLLAYNSDLKHLQIGTLEDDGIAVLAAALEQNSSLSKLHFDGCEIMEGFVILADVLKHQTGLKELKIDSEMSLSDLGSITTALMRNETLEKLSIELIRGADLSDEDHPFDEECLVRDEQMVAVCVAPLRRNVALLEFELLFEGSSGTPMEIQDILSRNKTAVPDAVRRSALFIIGICRSTNFKGMGDFAILPKEVVRLIAMAVWATRRSPKWSYTIK